MNEPGTHKLTEALKGQPVDPEHNPPADVPGGPSAPQGPGSTPEEIAENLRREQAARPHGQPDRDDYLTHVGRGHQTHG